MLNVNILVWENGNEKDLVEVLVNGETVYSVTTYNLFKVLDWVEENVTNVDMAAVKVIYK